MLSTTLIDVIFKGPLNGLNLDFIKGLSSEARELRLDYPEVAGEGDDEIWSIFINNSESAVTIGTDKLLFLSQIVPNVFINIIRNEEQVELLIFFDLMDLMGHTYKERIDKVKSWSEELLRNANLKYFLCRFDNGDEDEYLFDSNKYFPLYFKL